MGGNNNCGRECGEVETLYAVGRNGKWCSHFGKQSGSSSKGLSLELPRPRNPTPRYMPKRKENVCSHEKLGHKGKQHYLSQPKSGNAPEVHEWRNKM